MWEDDLPANYHRVWIRFSKPETKRRLQAFRLELAKEINKPISMSKLVENIIEQYLDKNSPTSEPSENN